MKIYLQLKTKHTKPVDFMSLTTNNPIFSNSKSITNRNVRLTKDINDFLDFFLFSSETFNIFIKIYEKITVQQGKMMILGIGKV